MRTVTFSRRFAVLMGTVLPRRDSSPLASAESAADVAGHPSGPSQEWVVVSRAAGLVLAVVGLVTAVWPLPPVEGVRPPRRAAGETEVR